MSQARNLVVHTARVSYSGDDRLDITAKSADDDGKAFAPTWKLVNWGLKMRQEYKKRKALGDRGAKSFWDWAWKIYAMRYTEQMRTSYAYRRQAWDKLLARECVVLVCYCTEPSSCHRTVLAEILETMGARYAGELGADTEDDNQDDNQDDDRQQLPLQVGG
jgi:hypothetical protein